VAVALIAIGAVAVARAETDVVSVPVAQNVARGVWVIPGGIRPDRQPDGNSVVFETPEGLVAIDTGRHRWQREAILALATTQRKPIVAIINTHWHLDHVSGNPDLRAAYAGLQVYASDAIDGALEGFLAQSAKDSASYLEDPRIPEATREDIRGDLLTIRNGTALRPDTVIEESGALTIGGREFDLRLARAAVTAGDVWLYDQASRVAVLGDLVTLPVPFLDTACPAGWQAARREVSVTPFEVAIPGHGAPMTRARFELYRNSFGAFLDCAKSDSAAEVCVAQWTESVGPLLEGGEGDRQRAERMTGYYAGLLREYGDRSPHCAAEGGVPR